MGKYFFSCTLLLLICGCQNYDSSNLKYWSNVMHTNPANEKLNSFTFEEKYKIIEFAYNEKGIHSNYSYEQISAQIENNEAFMSDEFLYGDHQINRLAHYVFAFWGSKLNLPNNPNEKFNYVKLSDQIWSFEGDQGDLKYDNYIQILEKMRSEPSLFSNFQQTFNAETNSFDIYFEYNGVKNKWNIINEVPGSINNIIFDKYLNICNSEFINQGNYYLIMASGGGIAVFLTDSTEQYLRKLWDFPKMNKRGSLGTLREYGKL